MKQRLVAAILLVTLLLSTLSCAKKDQETQNTSGTTLTPDTAATTTQSEVQETVSPYDENGYLKDELPEDLNLNQETVNIHIDDYNSAYAVEMYAAELTGDRLKDTVYRVIQSVEERLNVNLEYQSRAFPWAEYSAVQKEKTNEILSGSTSFDLLFGPHHYVAQMVSNNYFVDLSDTPYIDLSKPWYNQDILKTVMPTDYINFVAGAFSLVNVKSAFAMYYNADLYASLGGTENLIETVKQGKWTLDKMEALSRDVYSDINGNHLADGEDRYGITFGDFNKYFGFIAPLDIEIIARDETGAYVCNFDSERAVDSVARLCALIHDNPTTLPARAISDTGKDSEVIASVDGNYVSRPFMNGNALFSFSLVSDAAVISPNVEFNFGILPYPKWDEAQEKYKTSLMRACYALIPTTVTNEEYAGAVLEALASETYRTLVPEYCDVMLKTRYSNSEEVSSMYDLILDSIIYDPGVVLAQIVNTPTDTYRTALHKNTPNWTSIIKANKMVMEKKLAALIPD